MFNAYLFAFHKPLCPVPYPARCLPLNESIHRLCHVNAKRERVPSLSSFMAPHHYNLPALALSSFACPRWYECVWSVCETVFVFMLSFASICLSLFAHCRYGHRIWALQCRVYTRTVSRMATEKQPLPSNTVKLNGEHRVPDRKSVV